MIVLNQLAERLHHVAGLIIGQQIGVGCDCQLGQRLPCRIAGPLIVQGAGSGQQGSHGSGGDEGTAVLCLAAKQIEALRRSCTERLSNTGCQQRSTKQAYHSQLVGPGGLHRRLPQLDSQLSRSQIDLSILDWPCSLRHFVVHRFELVRFSIRHLRVRIFLFSRSELVLTTAEDVHQERGVRERQRTPVFQILGVRQAQQGCQGARRCC
mmetsp:Transcript_8076/g.19165  ORF Transcript_8076/g.19165 Transcript_8076/m.19165 type:complete len:209 (-) Transcript_8076:1598-2224(-)